MQTAVLAAEDETSPGSENPGAFYDQTEQCASEMSEIAGTSDSCDCETVISLGGQK